jgi:hypothetical protein
MCAIRRHTRRATLSWYLMHTNDFASYSNISKWVNWHCLHKLLHGVQGSERATKFAKSATPEITFCSATPTVKKWMPQVYKLLSVFEVVYEILCLYGSPPLQNDYFKSTCVCFKIINGLGTNTGSVETDKNCIYCFTTYGNSWKQIWHVTLYFISRYIFCCWKISRGTESDASSYLTGARCTYFVHLMKRKKLKIPCLEE